MIFSNIKFSVIKIYYFKVTEKEIQKGLLNYKDANNKALVFIREIIDYENIELNTNSQIEVAKKFIELDSNNRIDSKLEA